MGFKSWDLLISGIKWSDDRKSGNIAAMQWLEKLSEILQEKYFWEGVTLAAKWEVIRCDRATWSSLPWALGTSHRDFKIHLNLIFTPTMSLVWVETLEVYSQVYHFQEINLDSLDSLMLGLLRQRGATTYAIFCEISVVAIYLCASWVGVPFSAIHWQWLFMIIKF